MKGIHSYIIRVYIFCKVKTTQKGVVLNGLKNFRKKV